MQTLTDFLKISTSVDSPGTYEFYELPSNFPKDERLFIIKNIITSQTIYVRNVQNKVEVDPTYRDYNNVKMTKISIIEFFQRLKGIGLSYIEKV